MRVVGYLPCDTVYTQTQPVESWDEIENPWKLGEFDSGHREEIPKPGRRGNLYNVRVIVKHEQF